MKTFYDLAVASLLAMLLLIGAVAWALHAAGDGVATFTGHGDQAFLWRATAQDLGTSPELVRIVVFGTLHGLILIALSPVLRRGWGLLRGRLLAPPPKTRRRKRTAPTATRARRALELAGTATITLALVPLLLQPTLVPLSLSGSVWVERAANLVDGQASHATAGAMVAAWRWVAATAAPSEHAVSPADVDRTLRTGTGPLMDRWDPLIRAATADRVHFAQTKAFMWVESAGRQYAVSATGCAGLMQFCVSTARRRPFRQIFGVGQVAPCGCRGCGISTAVQRELESDPGAMERHRETFPCSAADARFDADKSIRAGAAYVRELADAFGGNLAVMYVGYNSGPAVARRLYRAAGQRPDATLDELGPHLAPALERYYGAAAARRSRGLRDTHLPKLLRAYERYLE